MANVMQAMVRTERRRFRNGGFGTCENKNKRWGIAAAISPQMSCLRQDCETGRGGDLSGMLGQIEDSDAAMVYEMRKKAEAGGRILCRLQAQGA